MNKYIFLILSIFILHSCDGEDDKAKTENVKGIKGFVIGDLLDEQTRKISGFLAPANTSELSFSVSGKVTQVNKNIGDEVKKGEVLAVMESTEYDAKLSSARSELSKAEASLNEKKKKYMSTKELYQEKYVSERALETDQSAYQASLSGVDSARANLQIAQKDVGSTKIIAPYDGVIAERNVEPFTEIKSGETVFVLNGKSAKYKIETNIPEKMIGYVALGDNVTISFPALKEFSVQGEVSKVSAQSDNLGSYPIQIMIDANDRLKSGMSAEIEFSLSKKSNALNQTANQNDPIASGDYKNFFMVPMNTVLPDYDSMPNGVTSDGKGGKGFVFLYDPSTNLVKKIKVEVKALQDNYIGIRAGEIKDGSIIAAAGLNFLQDGQKVKLLEDNANQ